MSQQAKKATVVPPKVAQGPLPDELPDLQSRYWTYILVATDGKQVTVNVLKDTPPILPVERVITVEEMLEIIPRPLFG